MSAVVPEQSSQLLAESMRHLFAHRHSCRAFKAEAVPRDVIEHVVSMAARTASWCNAQPWQVIVTAGSGTDRFRGALLEHADRHPAVAPDLAFPREYAGVYRERKRQAAFQLYQSVGVFDKGREAWAAQARENFRLFGAPHVAIVTTEESLGVYGAIDCGAFIGGFMLAAQALGVASIAQASIAAHASLVRTHFSLPSSRLVVCGISFGYEDETHPANAFRTDRAPLSTLITWDEQ